MKFFLPVPASVSLDEDGGLNVEWCFGEQGAQNSWRLLYVVDSLVDDERGSYLIETRYRDSRIFWNDDARRRLREISELGDV